MILWLLSTRLMYGQELAAEIAKRKGEKPNPGTLYPALRDLNERGLVHFRKEGRTTVYELTAEGRSGFAEARRYFTRAFGEIIYSGIRRRE